VRLCRRCARRRLQWIVAETLTARPRLLLDHRDMDTHDLHRLRVVLAALKETQIPPAVERRLLAEFQRPWPPRKNEDRTESPTGLS
jgi:hypothetical protein